MFRFIRNKNPEPDLCQLDCLFGETVCKLPVNEQIAYCTRLIERSNFQLRQECPKRDSKHLKWGSDLIATKSINSAHKPHKYKGW